LLKKENIKLLLQSLIISLTITGMYCLACYAGGVSRQITDGVIRFHVLANSDTEEDQALKEKVRDGVLAFLEDGLKQSQSKAQTREFIIANTANIEKTAKEIMSAEGFTYAVRAELTVGAFPSKTYADVTLPAGDYETLRVTIGDGGGKNWWCVMFPPLCFVKETKLSENEKTALTTAIGEEDIKTVKAKFFVAELWQKVIRRF